MQKFLLRLLLLYKKYISPIFPRRCRFHPSCSQYAHEAIKKKGVWKGILYACVRIFKCHPFHPGGYDPVSPVRNSKEGL